MRRWTVLAILVLAITSATAAAAPEDRAAAREHYDKGTKAFDLGRYDEAIHEYVVAYELVNDPALLYNLAQAHRLAGHARDALRFFRVYLSKVPNAENREDVEAKIVELQKTVDQEQKAQHELPPDGSLKPQPTTAEPATTTTPAATVEAAPPIDRRPARRLELAGAVTAGAGIVLLGVGAAMTGLSYQTASDIHDTPYDQGVIDGKIDTFHTYQALEGVFFAVGGAALAAGVVTWAIGRHRAHSPRVALVPTGLRAGGGLAACGAF